jgi:hypothetical protein
MSRNFEKIELRKEKVLSSIQNVLQQVDTKKINNKDISNYTNCINCMYTFNKH